MATPVRYDRAVRLAELRLADEPGIMPRGPDRLALILSGHTHGRPLNLFGWALIVPFCHGRRFMCGHVRGRDLGISAGIGCSALPRRLGAVSEITTVALAGEPRALPRSIGGIGGAVPAD